MVGKRLFVAVLGGAGLLYASSCTTSTQPSEIIFPSENVSYIRHVQPLLSLSCAFSGCHGEVNPAGGIILTSYSNVLFSRGNMIVPGKPDESLLYRSMTNVIPHPYDVMSRINDNHKNGIRVWITEGAISN